MRLIDADALTKQLEHICESCTVKDPMYVLCGSCGIEAALDASENIPTAQQWIPVTERLPEPHKAVLAYAPKYNNIWAVTINENEKWFVWVPGIPIEYNQEFNGDLVAWMPLPPAWKGEEG